MKSLFLLIVANVSVFTSVAFAQGLQFVQSENGSGLLYADQFASTIGEIEPLLFAYSKMPAVGPTPGTGLISSYKLASCLRWVRIRTVFAVRIPTAALDLSPRT